MTLREWIATICFGFACFFYGRIYESVRVINKRKKALKTKPLG